MFSSYLICRFGGRGGETPLHDDDDDDDDDGVCFLVWQIIRDFSTGSVKVL
jgi:hypothetical protein